MRAVKRIRTYGKALRRARKNRSDLFGWLGRRPLVLASTVTHETALLFSNRLEPNLKELAELKVAGMVSCEFCLDIGSALALYGGLTERQLADLPRYRTSDAYSDVEKAVLAFAEAATATPAVGEDLAERREELLKYLTKTQVAELAATIAWENQRARLNQALGVRPTGIADGLACALPEPRPA